MGGTLTLVGLMSTKGELPLVGWMSTMVANIEPVRWDLSIRIGLSGSSLVGVAPIIGSKSRRLGSQLNDGDLSQYLPIQLSSLTARLVG